MTMIKVCYIPHGGMDYTIIKGVARILAAEGVEFVFVTKTKALNEICRADGFESYWVGKIFDQDVRFSKEELRVLDLKYGPPGISSLCNSDIYVHGFLSKKHMVEKEQSVARAYKFWENFFDTHRVDYIMSVDMESLPARAAYNVARTRNKPLIWKITVGPGDGYFALCDVGEEYCWSELVDALKAGPRPLTHEEQKFALDFVKKRTELKKRAPHTQFTMPPALAHRIYSLIGTKLREVRQERLHRDPFAAAMERYFFYKLFTRTWYKYVTKNIFRYDDIADERYVYLPILYKNEQRNLASYYYWTQNFFSLIKEVAGSLPVGVKLYVKEHHFMYGEIPLRWLRKVQAIDNVKVITRTTAGQELIDNCEALITVSSTSGWEAYLGRKPVLLLNPKIFFSRSRLVYNVGSPCELPGTLFRAIQKGPRIYEENEEEWLWFIFSVISTCGEGEHKLDEEENYRKMASYIGQKIKRTYEA